MPSTFFTPLMGFAMRPNETNWPARYHRGNMDLFWQKELKLPFQMEADYEQKVETGDPIRFQVKSSPNTNRTLDIIDCRGKYIATLPYTFFTDYPGDLDENGQQYRTYHYSYPDWKNISGLGDIFRGTYYFIYKVQYDLTNADLFISEPLLLKPYHANTVLMEVSHPRYLFGSPFDVIEAIFRFRFEGYLEEFNPRSVATVFNNQKQNAQVLSFTPYRVHKLFVGEPAGVADWVFEKLNWYLGCRFLSIDGKQYSISSNSPSWNKDVTNTTPQKTGNIELQEADSAEGYTMPVRKLKLWTSPATFPYVISGIVVGLFSVYGPKRFNGAGDEVSFVTPLNTALAATELRGTITLEGGTFYYNLAAGETYKQAKVGIYTKRIEWNLIGNGPAPDTAVVTVGGFEGVVDWGGGAMQSATIPVSIPQELRYTYSGFGLHHIDLWWGSLQHFELTQMGAETLQGIGSPNMQTLIVNNHIFTGGIFYFGLVSPAANTIEKIDLKNNNLTGANNMPNWVFNKLRYLDYSGCQFSSTVMNLLLVDCNANAGAANPDIMHGYISTENQTPPAVIASNGQAAVATLRTVYRWTVRY